MNTAYYDTYIPHAWPTLARNVIPASIEVPGGLLSVVDTLRTGSSGDHVGTVDPYALVVRLTAVKSYARVPFDRFSDQIRTKEGGSPTLGTLSPEVIGRLIVGDYIPPATICATVSQFFLAQASDRLLLRARIHTNSGLLGTELSTLTQNIWRLGHPHTEPEAFEYGRGYRLPLSLSTMLCEATKPTDSYLTDKVIALNEWLQDNHHAIPLQLGALSVQPGRVLSSADRIHITQGLEARHRKSSHSPPS